MLLVISECLLTLSSARPDGRLPCGCPPERVPQLEKRGRLHLGGLLPPASRAHRAAALSHAASFGVTQNSPARLPVLPRGWRHRGQEMRVCLILVTPTIFTLSPGNSFVLLVALESNEILVPERLKTAGFAD